MSPTVDGTSVPYRYDDFGTTPKVLQFGPAFDHAALDDFFAAPPLLARLAKTFFRTAFEYQYWDASSGYAASGSFAGLDNGGDIFLATTGSSAPGLIVDFVGLSVGTGFTW